MTDKQRIFSELQELKGHLEQIELLNAQIESQSALVKELDRCRREDGFPKAPQLSTSMSTACRDKQSQLLANWENLPKWLAWLFIAGVFTTWLLLRGAVDMLDPLVMCVLIFIMMRQHKHLWTAVTCLLTGAWAFGAQHFSDTQELTAMVPIFVGYGAVAFKVVHQIIQAVRLFLLTKEEQKQLALEAADYESLCARHEKNCQRVQQENDEKYNPQIQAAQEELERLESRRNRHQQAADNASVLHDSDKKLDEVAYLIHRFETKRADTLKEALLQYDAMEERKAAEQRHMDQIRFQSEMDRMNRRMEDERRAQQALDDMERNWHIQQQQRRQADELERIRMALEN